jgi:hypothetical protein
VSISWDRGLSWDFRNNIPLAQFYEIDVDNKVPFTVCGGLQDNGEWCIPSAVRDRNGIANRDSWNIGGGDGFYVKFDRSDENYAYAESQNGNASRVHLSRWSARREARAAAAAGRRRAGAAGGAALRFNWDTPIETRTSIRASSTSARRWCPVGGQRRDVDGDQSRPHDRHRSGDAADHGRAVPASALAQRRHVAVRVADVDR